MNLGKRERWLLIVLAILVVIWSGRWLLGSLGEEDGEGSAATASRPGMEEEAIEVAVLHLAELKPKSGEFHAGRDIFRYGRNPARRARRPKPKPKPKPKPVAAKKGSKGKGAAGKPKPPPVNLLFLGSFGPADAPLAALTDGETIYNVREGGTVAEKFTVEAIGYESVDIGFVKFPKAEPKRLPAGG